MNLKLTLSFIHCHHKWLGKSCIPHPLCRAGLKVNPNLIKSQTHNSEKYNQILQLGCSTELTEPRLHALTLAHDIFPLTKTLGSIQELNRAEPPSPI